MVEFYWFNIIYIINYIECGVKIMKFNKYITALVICIAILSVAVSCAGLFLTGGPGEYDFKTINNEIVTIVGDGLYKNDSISVVAQGKASDLVTLVLGVPILLISLFFANKSSFKGKLLLTGTLGYFLYTYMSYSFLWTYNKLFIVYVLLMSASLFAFILSMCSFDVKKVPSYFGEKLPVKFLGGFQIFLAFAIGMLWLGKIAPTIFDAIAPAGLEHYTTLVIQAMDLGFVVPAAVISGILLIKRKPLGYLLSSVIIVKGITMLTSITAMIINQLLNGVDIGMVELIMFPLFNLITIICLWLLLKNVHQNSEELG